MTGLLGASVLVLLSATLVCVALRRRSAAARHLVWLGALVSVLILPLGALLPPLTLPSPVAYIAAVDSGTANFSNPATVSFSRWIAFIWVAGSLLLLARLAAGFVAAVKLIHSVGGTTKHGSYNVGVTPLLATPAAWGIGRNLVLLPEAGAAWEEERRRVVLLHEESHLRRLDCWALLVSQIACAVYWCNPLVWYAASRLRLEQEHAADDEVLASGIDPGQYAGHLVAIAKTRAKTGQHSAFSAPVLSVGAVHPSQLTVRVKAILDRRRNRTMANRKMIVAAAAMLLAITAPLASMQAGRKIYKVGDSGVVAPRLIHKEEPKYTEEAREAKIEGSVKLTGILEIDGKLHDVKVKTGLDSGLDANAIAAVETWRFEPAQKAGEPVPGAVTIEVNFRLL